MFHRTLLIALMAFTFTPDAMAQRAAPVIGIGLFSCGEYLAHRRDDGQDFRAAQTGIYVSWVFGYLSAYNQFSSQQQILELPGDATIVAYLDKYCAANPLGSVLSGTSCLMADLGGWSAKRNDCKH